MFVVVVAQGEMFSFIGWIENEADLGIYRKLIVETLMHARIGLNQNLNIHKNIHIFPSFFSYVKRQRRHRRENRRNRTRQFISEFPFCCGPSIEVCNFCHAFPNSTSQILSHSIHSQAYLRERFRIHRGKTSQKVSGKRESIVACHADTDFVCTAARIWIWMNGRLKLKGITACCRCAPELEHSIYTEYKNVIVECRSDG